MEKNKHGSKSVKKNKGSTKINNKHLLNKEIKTLQQKYIQADFNNFQSFNDYPLSKKTKCGLEDSDYRIPTKIQREAIRYALQGLDILGAAKTGSGKTLAFLIPLIERLYCLKWTSIDGVGALVITPTRELALQIFETVRKVGRYHDFSVGLIIGGKDLKFERKLMDKINIIICTPGRLLQHMDENPLFDCSSMKILILDEADRCLDLGFEQSMNAIIENLPKERQTLLFSATQTKSIKDLARLSLTDPKYISVDENEKHKTPEGLLQSYVVCDQHEKLDMLWSFITSHTKNKILVFFATCNQVKYFHEIMYLLNPKVNLMALHGKLHQLKRIEIYNSFCKKKCAVLFATDIAARGLDFPEVHWVVQLDCPEDVETYIHRAGRTARYYKGGECLLVLRPSEIAMVDYLSTARIPISQIKVNPAKLSSPHFRIEAMVAGNRRLKETAQRAFVSYSKSIFLMKDKSIFDVKSIDVEKFSRSLGLAICPRIRYLKKHEKSLAAKKEEHQKYSGSSLEGQPEKPISSPPIPSSGAFDFGLDKSSDEEDDGEGDVLTVKRKDHEIEEDFKETLEDLEPIIKNKKKATAVSLAKRILKKNFVPNKKILFDEEGEAIINKRVEKLTDAGRQYEATEEGGINIEEARKVLKEEDRWDKQLYKENLRARRLKDKLKKKRVDFDSNAAIDGQPEEEAAEGDDDGESSDASGPDLSWLPDPDKVYGSKDHKQDSESASSSDEEENPTKRPKLEHSEESDSSDFISLRDKEELALRLLNS